MKRLSKVEDVFQISGRGLVVMPGIPLSTNWHLKVGDKLFLNRPDGTDLISSIQGIEMTTSKHPTLSILLSSDLSKDDVPIGTEIWVANPVDDNIRIDQFGPKFRELVVHAKQYLEGEATIAELNGLVCITRDELKLTGNPHPEIVELLDYWEIMINRRWNEWGLSQNPLTEEEFRHWLRNQL